MANQPIYDALIRIGLKPHKDFNFIRSTDSLMQANASGIAKLVQRHFMIKQKGLHVSMLPNPDGIVETALITAADEIKRPGFWHIILDYTGRPVAEHPLTYSKRAIEPHKPAENQHQPPSGPQAALLRPKHPEVETHGDLARQMVSWFIYQDRVNDDDSAKVLEILSNHLDSPREILLPLPTQQIAQRLHDELICFEDDESSNQEVAVQAATLRRRIALLLKSYPV